MLTWSFFYSRQSKRSLNKMQIGLIRSASNRAAPPVPSHFALIRLRFANLLRTIWCSMKGGELECTAAFFLLLFWMRQFSEVMRNWISTAASGDDSSRRRIFTTMAIVGKFSSFKVDFSIVSSSPAPKKLIIILYHHWADEQKTIFLNMLDRRDESLVLAKKLYNRHDAWEMWDNRKMQKFAFSSASRIKDDDHRLMEIEVVLTHSSLCHLASASVLALSSVIGA